MNEIRDLIVGIDFGKEYSLRYVIMTEKETRHVLFL